MLTRRKVFAGLAAPVLLKVRTAATADEGLVVYNGQHRATTEALVRAFTKAAGAKVTLRNAESPELSSQIAEESARSPADVFFSEQSPPIAALQEKGLLVPIDAATLKTVPAEYAGKDGTWLGATVRTRVITYNKAMVKPERLPTSIMDFGTAALDGRFGYVKQDGFQEQVMAIARIKGHDAALDWLKGLKKYGQSYNGNRIASTAVENGEVAMALSNNYYWYPLNREKGAENLKSALHSFPARDPGNVFNVPAAGILKSSKRQDLAQHFIAFMVSKAGQEAMVATTAEYPVLPGATSPFPPASAGEFRRPGDACRRRRRVGGLRARTGRRSHLTMMRGDRADRPVPSWAAWGSLLPLALMTVPLGYLALRASQAGPSGIVSDLFRPYTLGLLRNTLVVAGTVTAASTTIAVAAAWLTDRCALPGASWWRLATVLPLAMPAYVSGFAWSSLGPAFQDMRGAILILTLYSVPLVYLPAPGRILALLGPSGCGKTTLLRLLAGFDRGDAGTISLDGTILDGHGMHVPPERRAVGYVPQEGLLFPHLSVAGNVAFGLSRAERRAGRVAETLRLVGLEGGLAERQPHRLSGGQQQRVALARALAPRPRLVLLDEPFNGLDGGLRRRVAADTAAVLREAGATAVLVTHDPCEAFAVADRVAVLQDGRVAQESEPSMLYRRPSTLAVARLTGPTVELSGEVRGGIAETALGRIPVLGSVTDGRAAVVLRPEQMRMADAADGCRAEVVAWNFAGSHTRVTASVDGQIIALQVAAEFGATVCIRLVVEGSGLAFPG